MTTSTTRANSPENAMHEHRFMSGELLSRVVYPAAIVCMHCGVDEGHDEVVWTGDDAEDCGGKKSGWEVWFCCHPCRDANRPCETFYPLRLMPVAVTA
jgi:hypothetical protein